MEASEGGRVAGNIPDSPDEFVEVRQTELQSIVPASAIPAEISDDCANRQNIKHPDFTANTPDRTENRPPCESSTQRCIASVVSIAKPDFRFHSELPNLS